MTVATYAWRRLDLEGLSFVRVEDGDGAVRVEGQEICVDGAERWSTRFTIELDGPVGDLLVDLAERRRAVDEHRAGVAEAAEPALLHGFLRYPDRQRR